MAACYLAMMSNTLHHFYFLLERAHTHNESERESRIHTVAFIKESLSYIECDFIHSKVTCPIIYKLFFAAVIFRTRTMINIAR